MMNMKINKIGIVSTAMLIAVSLQGCSKPTAKVETEEPVSTALNDEQVAGTDDLTTLGFLKLKDHYFKLAPDIVPGQESHLDFYVRDMANKHVTGATVQLNLVAPDGSKQVFNLTEDEGGEHYHNKTVLQKGKYQAIVQVKINNETYNPRFEFEV
jgi:hypothetical protein